MESTYQLRIRFPVRDRELSALHAVAFGRPTTAVTPWAERLERHSVSWVSAYEAGVLIGFVHACWDGGLHAFLLDLVVAPQHQRRGIGRDLVRVLVEQATAAGCEWLHVDYEPQLASFYEQACSFRTTAAGLLHLRS